MKTKLAKQKILKALSLLLLIGFFILIATTNGFSQPLIKLAFNENTGTAVANTGSVSATFTRTTLIPAWSTNVPSNVGGTSSVDFGTTIGNYAVESSAAISALGGLSSFTITGWVNCKSNTIGDGGNRIVSWINNGANGVDLVYNGDGSIQLGINEWPDYSAAISSTGKITTDLSATAANWRFFAVSYTASSGTVKFYFGTNTADASLDVTKTYSNGNVGTSIGRLAVGHFNNATRSAASDRMFRGLMDDIQIYGSELSLSQIVTAQKGSNPPPTYRNPENPANTVAGIDYKVYNGTWNVLPDFNALTPVSTGNVANFNISSKSGTDNFGFKFTGYINVPTDGTYTFYTSSDDGSKLYIGTTQVVNNDGLHGMQEASGTIGLKAGKHAITVTMFENGGGEGLSVSYAGPGISKVTIPNIALYRVAGSVDTQNPTTPSGLGASNIGQTSFTLSWTASTDNVTAQSSLIYEVFAGTTSKGTVTGSTSMNVSGLLCNTAYSMTVKAKDAAGNVSLASATLNVTTSACSGGGDGKVTIEKWTGVFGTTISSINWTTSPNSTSDVTKIEIPVNADENYGVRIRGYIVPSTTGSYNLYIASDDNGELWLSTNDQPANKAKIAYVSTWTSSQEWTKETNQKSAAKSLTAGQKYYFEAFMKDFGGGDNLAIGWTGPGIAAITVIGGSNISSYTLPNVSVTGITVNPTSTSIVVGSSYPITPTVSPANATNKTVLWTSSNNTIATVNGSGLVTSIATGTTTITVKTQDGNFTATCAVTVINPPSAGSMTPGTNLWHIGWSGWEKYFAAGLNWATTSNPWNPTFISELQQSKVKCLRFMDWNQTNSGCPQNWSQRIPKTANHYNVDNLIPCFVDNYDGPTNTHTLVMNGSAEVGVAYEWQIDLCNKIGADMWINIPMTATADYIYQLANLIKNQLGSGQKVYVEWANETWNWGFVTAVYSSKQFDALGLGSINIGTYCDPWRVYTVYASVRAFEQFERVFGKDSPRLVKVLAGQVGYHWPGYDYNHMVDGDLTALSNTILNPNQTIINAYAMAPYYNGNSVSAMQTSVNSIGEMMTWAKNSLIGKNISLVCYEGGADNWPDNGEVLTRDPAQEQLYFDYLTILGQICTGVFNQYTFYGGCWGIKVNGGESESINPKWRGWQRYWANPISTQKQTQATAISSPSANAGFITYPNPANDMLSLKFATQGGNVAISVFDVSGKEVLRTQLMNNQGAYQMNVGNLTSGLYLIQVSQGNISYTGKINIKK